MLTYEEPKRDPAAPVNYVVLDYDGIADDLRKHPGEWAVIDRGGYNRLAVKRRSWRYRSGGLQAPDFETMVVATAKTMPDGSKRGKLFARYVGA